MSCSIVGCSKPGRLKRGMCNMHYERWRTRGDHGEAAPLRSAPADRCCTVPECGRLYYARGYCKPHYARWTRTGDPGDLTFQVTDLWEKIDRQGPGGCWIWTGSLHKTGYGLVGAGGKMRWVHRHVYEMLVGPIPAGLELDHLCCNPPCCNPDHLEPVTHLENMQRYATRRRAS